VVGRVLPMAYWLCLLVELSRVHDIFNVSGLWRSLANGLLSLLLNELGIDKRLRFFEGPTKVVCQEKKCRRSKVPILRARWNSERDLSSDIATCRDHTISGLVLQVGYYYFLDF
jgi:hypothetical protein